MYRIGIIGAGVSGLTTAILLQEQGYEVVIHSQTLPQDSTSAKAAAIWLPYIARPVEQVNRWSRISFEVFQTLSRVSGSGICMTSLIRLGISEEWPVWSKAVPAGHLRNARKEELPAGYSFGVVAEVPLIETPLYLQYLLDRFYNSHGQLKIEKVNSLQQICRQYPVVINCSGLGAARLCDDRELYPVQGHLVKVEKAEGIRCIADDEGPNALAYIIPRTDCIILGGTSDAGIDTTEPVNEKVAGILHRCRQLLPEVANLSIIKTEAGVRPARPTIRCEKDDHFNLIHNYGHGGSGYTVSWGCAKEVVELVKNISKTPIRPDAL